MALGGTSPSEILGVRCSAFRPGVGNYDENLKSAQTNVSFATPFAALNDPCETSLPVDSFQRSFLASSPERPTTPQISHDPSRQEVAVTLVRGDIVRISPFYGRGISLIPTPPNSSRSHAPRGNVKPPQDASNAAAFEDLRRIQESKERSERSLRSYLLEKWISLVLSRPPCGTPQGHALPDPPTSCD